MSYGQATGAPSRRPLAALSAKSVTLSRPVLFHYTASPSVCARSPATYSISSRAACCAWRSGTGIRSREAARAHRELEARRTIGASVLLP